MSHRRHLSPSPSALSSLTLSPAVCLAPPILPIAPGQGRGTSSAESKSVQSKPIRRARRCNGVKVKGARGGKKRNEIFQAHGSHPNSQHITTTALDLTSREALLSRNTAKHYPSTCTPLEASPAVFVSDLHCSLLTSNSPRDLARAQRQPRKSSEGARIYHACMTNVAPPLSRSSFRCDRCEARHHHDVNRIHGVR